MPTSNYSWKFFRAGGFDQPRIDTPADVLTAGSTADLPIAKVGADGTAMLSLTDPYADKPTPWKTIVFVLFVVLGAWLYGIAFMAH